VLAVIAGYAVTAFTAADTGSTHSIETVSVSALFGVTVMFRNSLMPRAL
jgi:hypothetical protein